MITLNKSSFLRALSSANASNKAATIICSISAPANPSVLSASSDNSLSSIIRFPATSSLVSLFFKCSLKISFLSFSVGRSTKNISSNRPFLIISEGRLLMLFAVATTKTGFVLSCIHVRKVPNILEEIPPSPPEVLTPLKPFSISSIHKIEGATASAVWIALRIFSSVLPTMPLNIFPMSSRSNGSFHMALIALAVRLFPHPGTPVIRTPLGAGRLYLAAISDQDLFLFSSHRFKFSSPPTSSMLRSLFTNSNIPVFLITWFFSSRMTPISLIDRRPVSTIALASAFSTS